MTVVVDGERTTWRRSPDADVAGLGNTHSLVGVAPRCKAYRSTRVASYKGDSARETALSINEYAVLNERSCGSGTSSHNSETKSFCCYAYRSYTIAVAYIQFCGCSGTAI